MKHLRASWIICLGLSGLMGCGGSKFQTQTPPAAELPKVAEAPPVVSNAQAVPEPKPEPVAEKKAEPAPEPAPPATPPPAGAVVKGSFTVFAEPRYPKEGEDYRIFVRVTLPTGAGQAYKRRDLNIQVRGSDGFTATYPQNGPNDAFTDFTVKGDLAVASMLIPGANQNVKDAISVSSKVLQEMQQIDLIFGTPPK